MAHESFPCEFCRDINCRGGGIWDPQVVSLLNRRQRSELAIETSNIIGRREKLSASCVIQIFQAQRISEI